MTENAVKTATWFLICALVLFAFTAGTWFGYRLGIRDSDGPSLEEIEKEVVNPCAIR